MVIYTIYSNQKNNKRICSGYTINSSYERQHIFMQSKKAVQPANNTY